MNNFNKNNNSDKILARDKSAAHDLNNLLNNVLNGIELLRDSVSKDLKLLNLATHIEKNTLMAAEIVQQMSSKRDISKSNKSKINLLDISKEVKEIIEEGGNARLSIDIIHDDHDHVILGYSTEIKRLLLNLISNANESSRNKIDVQIYLKYSSAKENSNEKLINLVVSDNGPGIPDAVIANIFNEGFTTKAIGFNQGLGLSIVKSIIDKHSAKIQVSSKLGKGTTFSMFFPAINDSKYKSLENKKIIIAEDDKFQREVLKDLLQSMKINVFTASTGTEALDLFVSTNPDLLFIDETMPGMSGLQCSERIKQLNQDSQIVLVTGADIDEEYLRGTVSKILKKPYSFNSIKSTLSELL